MRNNKGFSLVELIVVIAIMAILAAVAIPTFATFITKAQQASDSDFMAQVESAVDLAFATEQTKPSKITVKYNPTDSSVVSITLLIGTENYVINKTGADTIPANATDSATQACADFKAVVDMTYAFKAPEKFTNTTTLVLEKNS
ncbi:MAG: type II secretion system protein [Clostridia bacterium]|nr:type II secretion system protein [Clostridia bacterium]MBO7297214.1 type II secretion system protein [Clostridia bacterium]